MTIAFVVLAIAALIFLFVYNSRVAKRSGKRQEARDESAKETPRNPEASPAVSIQEPPPAVEGTSVVSSESPIAAVPRAANRTALTEAELEAHRSASEGDKAYREALRKFAGYASEEVQQSKAEMKPDPSSDDAYREALRAMARNQEKKKD
ncbi:hypothetical protein [Paenibacillus solani]|uniref:hypothetical protein n=1 Tax=Paenibacillus solani TaxID=1705565 RepID=UPI003D271167